MKKIFLFLLFILIVSSAYSKEFVVGTGRNYDLSSKVMNLVQDGDTVLIDSGIYQEAGTWTRNNLLIRGIGGFAHVKAPAVISNQKAIWIITGNNNVIENIEFSDAKVPDKNGAGIRFEGTNLTVRHCYFHHCEDGILTGVNQSSVMLIEFSEFAYNGYGDGYSHNLYIGNIHKLTFRFNYTHHAIVGHCIKSRADQNFILYNRIMDENDGTSSYLINLPDGGIAEIFGNSLMQGPMTENRAMIDYGSESLSKMNNNLMLFNNTLINKRNPGVYVQVGKGTIQNLMIKNNIFAGYSADAANAIPTHADTSNNYQTTNIASLNLLDEQNFDYHLTVNSPVIDKGISFGSDELFGSEYKHKCDSAAVEFDGKPDIGAYQYPKFATYDNEELMSFTSRVVNNILYINAGKNDNSYSTLEIYSINGTKLTESKINTSGNIITHDISVLIDGIYFFQLTGGKERKSGKFVKY